MRLAGVALLVGAGLAHANNLTEADKLLKQIKAVSKEGTGNQEAGAAWRQLVALGGEAILPTLAAMDDASPSAANWLRSAVNAMAEKEKAAGKKLPAEKLEVFVHDRKHEPAARRLAYEVLVEVDPKTPDRLLATMLDDPSVELRRDAVAAAMRKAERLEGEKAKAEWGRLFAAVRDDDQAKSIAEALEKAGGKADLVAQFGIVLNWQLAGPFDSPKGAGFDTKYEPEKKVDLKARYVGKEKADVNWKAHKVEVPEDQKKKYDLEEVGEVDLNKAIGKFKDAVVYAYAVIESDKEQPVEVRFGSITAVKVFLNGKPIFAREEYHHGERFDQYVAKGTLKAGKNELLVKLTQNDQKEPWAQVWQFKVRLCDATGGALPVKIVTPAN
jgi:hypothetical protein